MSPILMQFRNLGVVLLFALGALISGCSSGGEGPRGWDPGADRSAQQSDELRARINTTQVDR